MACRVNMNIKKEYYPALTNLYGKNGDVLDIRPTERALVLVLDVDLPIDRAKISCVLAGTV